MDDSMNDHSTERDWRPEGAAAAAVFLAGLIEAFWRNDYSGAPSQVLLVVTGVALAVLLSRHAPSVALALVWMVGAAQVLTGTQVLTVELVVAVVAFGCARWGSVATVVASGLSIPIAATVAVAMVLAGDYGVLRGIAVPSQIVDTAFRYGNVVLLGVVGLGMFVLAAPWLAGLLARSMQATRRVEVSQQAAEVDAARAQHEALQAQEIARLRNDQAQLARDVHDVVGHSLAVILAQAESAQYVPDDDPARLKQTLATIARSARSSLGDVRQVLSATATPEPLAGSLEELVRGVRAGGREVVVEEVGTPQPLPPELEVVAHRVLQEMLTNAVKHGGRESPIRVERHWPAGGYEQDLRIEVVNAFPDVAATVPIRTSGGSGQGLEGMRRRLDSVGGKLDVRRRDDAFTAIAWVPVRAR